MSRIKKELENLRGISYAPSDNEEDSLDLHGIRKDIDVIGFSYMRSFPVFKNSIRDLDERVSDNTLAILLNLLFSGILYFKLRKVEENENAKNSLGENS